MKKALILFSGGLDSILATKLMQEQEGISVEGIHFVSIFTSDAEPDSEHLQARRAARELKMPLIVEENSGELLEQIKAPRFGLGSNMNPCIDCRIRNIRRAAEVMPTIGAHFLVTGEVVGERPMSQNRQSLRLIEKESEVEGLLLRPLSARLLAPTIPEEREWVDRSRLLDIHGRSRKPQMALAERYGITDYPSPAGGCLLTDPGFSARLRNLILNHPDCDLNDCRLLKFGRHFRLSPGSRIIVGRCHEENEAIEELARVGDRLLAAADLPGPVTLLRGAHGAGELQQAAAITARYGKGRDDTSVTISVWQPGDSRREGRAMDVRPASDEALDNYRIQPGSSMRKGETVCRKGHG